MPVVNPMNYFFQFELELAQAEHYTLTGSYPGAYRNGSEIFLETDRTNRRYAFREWDVKGVTKLSSLKREDKEPNECANVTGSALTFPMPSADVQVRPVYDLISNPAILHYKILEQEQQTAELGAYSPDDVIEIDMYEYFNVEESDYNYYDYDFEISAIGMVSGKTYPHAIGDDSVFRMTMPEEEVSINMGAVSFRTHNITTKVNNAGFGSITAGRTAQVYEQVTITATPGANYKLNNWTVNGVTNYQQSGNSISFTMPNNDVEITANFILNVYLVTANSNAAHGSITGGGNYSVGQTVTITATPTANYNLTDFTVSGATGTKNIAARTFTFTMPNNAVTVTAVYAIKTFTLTVRSNNNVFGTVSGTASGTYQVGTAVTITANPANDYMLERFDVSGVAASITGNQCKFNMPLANVTVTANFTPYIPPNTENFQFLTAYSTGTHVWTAPATAYYKVYCYGKSGNGGSCQDGYGWGANGGGAGGLAVSKLMIRQGTQCAITINNSASDFNGQLGGYAAADVAPNVTNTPGAGAYGGNIGNYTGGHGGAGGACGDRDNSGKRSGHPGGQGGNGGMLGGDGGTYIGNSKIAAGGGGGGGGRVPGDGVSRYTVSAAKMAEYKAATGGISTGNSCLAQFPPINTGDPNLLVYGGGGGAGGYGSNAPIANRQGAGSSGHPGVVIIERGY